MNRTDRSSALVRYGIKSLGADSAAPLAICRLTPRSRGMQVANVVLPKPGRAVEQDMPQRFAPLLRGIDGDFQPGVHLALADHVAHPLRAQLQIVLRLGRIGAIAAAARARLESRSRSDFDRHAMRGSRTERALTARQYSARSVGFHEARHAIKRPASARLAKTSSVGCRARPRRIAATTPEVSRPRRRRSPPMRSPRDRGLPGRAAGLAVEPGSETRGPDSDTP